MKYPSRRARVAIWWTLMALIVAGWGLYALTGLAWWLGLEAPALIVALYWPAILD